MTDLGLFSLNDHVLVKALPVHRDGIALHVLTGPRVHNRGESSVVSPRSERTENVVLRVVALPRITHWVISTSLRELLDLIFSQVSSKIQVPLCAARGDVDGLISFGSDRTLIKWKSLTRSHGRNRTGIEQFPEASRVGKAPIRKRTVL